MPSTRRRSFLMGLSSVSVVGLAGCSAVSSDDLPAGSLQFVNDHSVPHSITMRVTGVGSEIGEGTGTVTGDPLVPPAQQKLSAATSIKPGETETYESVFTESVWYAVQFTVDGREPENDAGVTAFRPSPTDQATGKILSGKVDNSGEFSWVVSSTENEGPFGE